MLGEQGSHGHAERGDDGARLEGNAGVVGNPEELVGAEPVAGERKGGNRDRQNRQMTRDAAGAVRGCRQKQRDSQNQEGQRRRGSHAHGGRGGAQAPIGRFDQRVDSQIDAGKVLQQRETAESRRKTGREARDGGAPRGAVAEQQQYGNRTRDGAHRRIDEHRNPIVVPVGEPANVERPAHERDPARDECVERGCPGEHPSHAVCGASCGGR